MLVITRREGEEVVIGDPRNPIGVVRIAGQSQRQPPQPRHLAQEGVGSRKIGRGSHGLREAACRGR